MPVSRSLTGYPLLTISSLGHTIPTARWTVRLRFDLAVAERPVANMSAKGRGEGDTPIKDHTSGLNDAPSTFLRRPRAKGAG